MVSIEQWRAAIGCFTRCGPTTLKYSCMYLCNVSLCVLCLLVYANIVALLLIASGNVELNPGPSKNVHNVKPLCLIERLSVHVVIHLENAKNKRNIQM